MPLTPEDVQNKRFTVVRFGKSGYDEEEVDTFLDEIEAEMRRLLAESDSLRTEAAAAAAAAELAEEQAKAAPEPVPEPAPAPAPAAAEDPNETALRTLLLAQRTADDAIAQAKSEAEQMLNEARMHAASIERDAQAEHAAKRADLEAQRAGVEAQIAELREYERDYRTRLRAYLEGQLSDLENLASQAPPSPPSPAPVPGQLDLGGAPSPSDASGFEAFTPPAVAPSIPGLMPPTTQPPASPPDPAGSGQFSTASPPGPAPMPLPPHPATLTPKSDPGTGFDTDVDAGSDVPSGPPAQADDTPQDSSEDIGD
jgi:DivIVA domain-containing protein